MRLRCRLAALTALCLSALLAPAEIHWTEVRSPHFRVITDSSPADARKVAEEFEQMRYVIHWRFPGFNVDPNTPLIIIAARDESTARGLQPLLWKQKGEKPAGEFLNTWERNFALIRMDTWSAGAREVVYHEYTHSILHLNAHWLPMWLDEGMAEFFAYTRFENKRILIGEATARWRALTSHALIPVATMLERTQPDVMRDNQSAQLFYAEAWALVHYMTFGPGMQNGKLLSDFYQRIEAGTDQKTAFTAVFGPTSAFDQKFEAYLGNFLLSAGVIPSAPPLDPANFTERKLSPVEALYQQAIFHVASFDYAGARILLEQSHTLDPNFAPTHEELGFLDYYDGNDQQARAEWQIAYTFDPTLHRSLFAETITGTPFREQTPLQRAATLEALRKVVHINLWFAPAYVEIAILNWWQGDLDAAYRAASQAASLEPWRPGYHLLCAEILLAQNKGKQAAVIARDTAMRFTDTDKYEAIELWQQVPPNDRDAGPALAIDLPDGARLSNGTLTAVRCGDRAQGVQSHIVFQPTGEPTQAPLELTSTDRFRAGFVDTLWVGGDHINPCHHTLGHHAVIAWKPTTPNHGDMLWVDIHDDLPPRAPAPGNSARAATTP